MNAAAMGKVAVLMGGHSAERAVSLKSGAAVLAALQLRGVDAHALDARDDVLGRLQREGFDRAFIILHGRGGEDGVIQGALQTLDLPYTGSGVLASALGMDKLLCKRLWSGAGVMTAEYLEMQSEQDATEVERWLGFPVFIKPALEGSSLGMTRAGNAEEARAGWRLAAGYGGPVFAERFIDGAEYTVAILNDMALPVIRVKAANAFYDYDAKYEADTTSYHCPCGLDEQSERRLQDMALNVFRMTGCHGWARVDFMVDGKGSAYVLEINTVPGMTDHSLVPMAAKAAGITFEELVYRILESSNVTRR